MGFAEPKLLMNLYFILHNYPVYIFNSVYVSMNAQMSVCDICIVLGNVCVNWW
jgi:hypothetical protein